MNKRKLAIKAIIAALSIAVVLMGVVIAQIFVNKNVSFTAHIKTTSGLAVYYGTNQTGTEVTSFDFGEFDVSSSDAKQYFNFTVKNIGNTGDLNVTLGLDNMTGWTYETPNTYNLERKVSSVSIWQIQFTNQNQSLTFIAENSTYTPTANILRYVTLHPQQTQDFSIRLTAHQQLTYSESISFVISVKGSNLA